MPNEDKQDGKSEPKKRSANSEQSSEADFSEKIGRLTEVVAAIEIENNRLGEENRSLRAQFQSMQSLNRELSGRLFSTEEDIAKADAMVNHIKSLRPPGEYVYKFFDKRYIHKDRNGKVITDTSKVIKNHYSNVPFAAKDRDEQVRREFNDRYDRKWTGKRVDPLRFVPATEEIEF